LIDTSVAIDLEEVDRTRLPAEMARARRRNRLQRFGTEPEALAFDSACARAYGSVYAAVAGAGRKPRGARAVDLMIAATALAYELPLYTRNVKDLQGLESLIEILNVGA